MKLALRLPLTEELLLRVPELLSLLLPVAAGEEELQVVPDREGDTLGDWLPEPEMLPETLLTTLGAMRVALALGEAVLQPLLLPLELWLTLRLPVREELTVEELLRVPEPV